MFRTNARLTFVGLALFYALLAIVAAPLVMPPAYRAMSPALGPMTIWVVEIIFVLLIDAPLAALFVATLTLLVGPPPSGGRAAVKFFGIFLALILLAIAAAPLHPVIAWLALADTFTPALSASLAAFGPAGHGLLSVMFLAFDVTACAAAGVTAKDLVTR